MLCLQLHAWGSYKIVLCTDPWTLPQKSRGFSGIIFADLACQLTCVKYLSCDKAKTSRSAYSCDGPVRRHFSRNLVMIWCFSYVLFPGTLSRKVHVLVAVEELQCYNSSTTVCHFVDPHPTCWLLHIALLQPSSSGPSSHIVSRSASYTTTNLAVERMPVTRKVREGMHCQV